MWAALRGLFSLLPAQDDLKSKLKLVISVDECQVLTSIRVSKNTNKNRPMLDYLAYVIGECQRWGIVGVILSKSSILTYVPVVKELPSSAREVERLFLASYAVPFSYLAFDSWQNDEPILRESVTSLFDACKIGFLARFGRPL